MRNEEDWVFVTTGKVLSARPEEVPVILRDWMYKVQAKAQRDLAERILYAHGKITPTECWCEVCYHGYALDAVPPPDEDEVEQTIMRCWPCVVRDVCGVPPPPDASAFRKEHRGLWNKTFVYYRFFGE